MTKDSTSVAWVSSLLEFVKYRPGWTIEAFKTPYHDRVWVLIDAEVLDALNYDHSLSVEDNYRAGNTTRVGVRAVVPRINNAPAFYR